MRTVYTNATERGRNRWKDISPDFVLKLIATAVIIFALHSRINAQAALTTTINANSQTLAQLVAGSGVTISNYTLTCNANGSGTFNNNSSNLGLNGGVVLSSGRVSAIPNVSTVFASTQFTLS